MKSRGLVLLLSAFFAIAATGCYHQIVETGRTPGPTVVNRTATSWVFGLISTSSSEIDVRTLCPSGVAVVETQQSFINGLLAALTIGIYTPQTVTVTCAAGAGEASAPQINVPQTATSEQLAAAVDNAVVQSLKHEGPVVIRF
jgi:hypothetical protein